MSLLLLLLAIVIIILFIISDKTEAVIDNNKKPSKLEEICLFIWYILMGLMSISLFIVVIYGLILIPIVKYFLG